MVVGQKFRGVRTYRVADPASSGSLAPYSVKGRYETLGLLISYW